MYSDWSTGDDGRFVIVHLKQAHQLVYSDWYTRDEGGFVTINQRQAQK